MFKRIAFWILRDDIEREARRISHEAFSQGMAVGQQHILRQMDDMDCSSIESESSMLITGEVTH